MLPPRMMSEEFSPVVPVSGRPSKLANMPPMVVAMHGHERQPPLQLPPTMASSARQLADREARRRQVDLGCRASVARRPNPNRRYQPIDPYDDVLCAAPDDVCIWAKFIIVFASFCFELNTDHRTYRKSPLRKSSMFAG